MDWSKDDILLTHIKDALDSTEQEDFVFTVSVQGHGNYPTEKVIENPKITVTRSTDRREEQCLGILCEPGI